MITKIEQRLTWLMALVGVVGLVAMLKADLFAVVFLQISCRELIHGGDFMEVVAQIARSMPVVMVNGFFIITIFVAAGCASLSGGSRSCCMPYYRHWEWQAPSPAWSTMFQQ